MSILKFITGALGALWVEKTGSRKDVARLQQRRVEALLAHAVAHVPFQRRRLGDVPPPVSAWKDIAPVTKVAMMEQFNDTIADGVITLEQVQAFARDKERVGTAVGKDLILSVTSGTTGVVGYFVTDRGDFERTRGTLLARLLRHHLLDPREVLRFGPWHRYRMGFVTAMGGHFVTYNLSLHAPWLGKLLWKPGAFNILTPLQKMNKELMAFKPHFLHGYPTFMEALAHEQLQGRLAINPEVISLGSEPFTALARVALQAAFPRTYVAETYGSTECVAIATQCKHGRMHINEDICVLESVDAQGKPVLEGTLGVKVLLTNLINYTQPLIRYEIGDQVVIQKADCPCGSPFRSVKVVGRSDDTFYLRGEDARYHAHTPIPFEALFLDVDGLAQYQLVHEAQNQLRVFYTRDGRVDAAGVKARLESVFGGYFKANGLSATVTLSLEETEEIPRDPNTKKIRQIVSRVPPPTDAAELSGPWRLKGIASNSGDG